MKRLFAAFKVTLDKEFFMMYRTLKAQLSEESIKWVEDYNIHITIKFLGETPDKKIGEICEILKSRSELTPEFSIEFSNLGIFGSRYSPRVIWLGVEPYTELAGLIKNLQVDLRMIGYQIDSQNVVPHLTLGRIRFINDKQRFQKILDNFSGWRSQLYTFDRMILYESILHQKGPEYLEIEKFALQKTPEVIDIQGSQMNLTNEGFVNL